MGGMIGSTATRKVRDGQGGAIVVMSKERARKLSAKKGGGRNGWQLNVSVNRDMAFDIDARFMVAFVTVGLARFYSKMLLAGRRPGGEPMPQVRKRTKQYDAREGDQYGTRSGFMAKRWWVGKIGGTRFQANRIIKPYGGDGPSGDGHTPGSDRSWTINALLKRKAGAIDFQGVRGRADQEIGRLVARALRMMGPDIRSPARVDMSPGTILEKVDEPGETG